MAVKINGGALIPASQVAAAPAPAAAPATEMPWKDAAGIPPGEHVNAAKLSIGPKPMEQLQQEQWAHLSGNGIAGIGAQHAVTSAPDYVPGVTYYDAQGKPFVHQAPPPAPAPVPAALPVAKPSPLYTAPAVQHAPPAAAYVPPPDTVQTQVIHPDPVNLTAAAPAPAPVTVGLVAPAPAAPPPPAPAPAPAASGLVADKEAIVAGVKEGKLYYVKDKQTSGIVFVRAANLSSAIAIATGDRFEGGKVTTDILLEIFASQLNILEAR